MIEFSHESADTIKVTRNDTPIGRIQRIKRKAVPGTDAESVICWEASIEGHIFSDSRPCIVKQQIRDILDDRPIEVTPAGLTALQQAKLIFDAAAKIKAS